MKPWFEVAVPHEDIRKGTLGESVFAANVWAVVQGTAPQLYLDPESFFHKTHMTRGLATLLSRVSNCLGGSADAGDRVISLQTSFGGGKTHALVALFHLAKNASTVRGEASTNVMKKALGKNVNESRKVAVFTNATCDVTQGRVTKDGTRIRTLWGELAYQLGGPKLYQRIRANDETMRVPQGLFVEVLKEAAPCLILLDELADYCVGAAAVPVGDTTLADQTISFIQQLTEAIQQVPQTVVVATLPASKYEVAQSEKGQEAFVTLEKRFQRLGADVKPVADDEIYEVVRARLFETVAAGPSADEPRKVADHFLQAYAAHSAEVPSDATKPAYRDQILRSYPFHPLLVDALYTRWGSHPDFQRTRGVLRLLASIVGDLWKRKANNTQSQPLIQPCHINWSLDPLQAALTRYWGPAYQSVAAADVVGDRANAFQLDEERGGDYRNEKIGQGLASAILLGSFGGQADRAGFDSKLIKLAVSRPTLNWNYTDGGLLDLDNRSYYLHAASAGNAGKRYWYGTKPTLNKLVVTYRQQFDQADFKEEILELLRSGSRSTGGEPTWRVIVDPGEELPEQKALTLVLLPPDKTWADDDVNKSLVKRYVLGVSSKCGGRDRKYRNTLVFLAPTAKGMGRLRQALRERETLQAIRRDYGEQLSDEQKLDLADRLRKAEEQASQALGPSYGVALRVAGREVQDHVLPDARPELAEHLQYAWTQLTQEAEWILKRLGSVTLRDNGLIPTSAGLRVQDALDSLLRLTDKPIISSPAALVTGLEQACLDGLIGIGHGPAAERIQSKVCRQRPTILLDDPDSWIIPPFAEQAPSGASAPPTPGAPAPPDSGPAAPDPTVNRGAPVDAIIVRGKIPVENWTQLFGSFLGPGMRLQPKKFEVEVGFVIEMRDGTALGADSKTVKDMVESARQLGLTIEVRKLTKKQAQLR